MSRNSLRNEKYEEHIVAIFWGGAVQGTEALKQQKKSTLLRPVFSATLLGKKKVLSKY